ncbi:hypothetical protein E1264_03765 [Actinomadura sp. KC216]|uniref:DUF7574 domain-containing protein n=1 Tax=Actinomadura sp. KC216 TaxID=2530370 RepID=UPI0010477D9E|nr:hypothetical protein [Actinomadura sp. KC216]TDB90933.1 hypothetical protein E1264_03765 [Actinomadura sp. KC216]
MPSYDKNIYYKPEASGLEIVVDIDIAGSWSFDMFVVWRETATGRLGYLTDSGCSCPSPFEDYTAEDIKWGERWEIAEAFTKWVNENRAYHSINDNAIVSVIDKVVNA